MKPGPTIHLIAALDRQRAIGRASALPWHLPNDLRRFKSLTVGKSIVMGRKTFAAIGKALPHRRNIVLSRAVATTIGGCDVLASIEAVLTACQNESDLMIIGGGEIYSAFLAHADRLMLTHVDTVVSDADAYFPPIDPTQWTITHRECGTVDADHAHPYAFVDYIRRR